MNQFYDNDTTVSISDVRREMLRIGKEQQQQLDALTQRLNDVKNVVSQQSTATNYSGIINILDNSLPEWSTAAYDATGVSPNTAGDGNMEAKDWYRQPASDLALTPGSANALKTKKTVEPADHSLWAANEATNLDIPRWSKTDAHIELGGLTQLWDIYYPIPNDTIFPGQRYTLQLEAMVDQAYSELLPAGTQFYCGFYDSSPLQQKYIEGGNFTITDDQGHDGTPGNEAVTFGVPGSTSVDYQIVALTDSGEEAISQILNFPHAPAVFDQNNHPRVKFTGVAGFIRFQIYRRIGTTYVLASTINNTFDGVFYDVGNPPEAYVPGFPTVTTTAPRAYAQSTNFTAGTIMGLGFVRNAFTIFVPTTYNRSLTLTGQQYLRMGLVQLFPSTSTPRRLWIRKIGLSLGDGNWTRSANDTRTGAHSTPSGSAATGSPPSGGGMGGGGVDPPAPVGGGHCVLLDTAITLDRGHCQLKDLQKAKANGRLADNGGPVHQPIKGVRLGHASHILRIKTDNGLEIGVTAGEPFITGDHDPFGTSAAILKERFDRGETVTTITRPYDQIEMGRIVSITQEYGDFTVGDPTVHGGMFWGNGFLLHNKPYDDFNAYF